MSNKNDNVKQTINNTHSPKIMTKPTNQKDRSAPPPKPIPRKQKKHS